MKSDTIPSEILDLCLMSKCYGAILSNSTFSYWGAMLSNAQSYKIYKPSNYFTNKLKHNSLEDFYPISWSTYEVDITRNSLEEITFTIPVFYDHQDRYDNLVLSLKMLYKYFKVRVIIMEEENNFFEDIITLFPKEDITYVKCNNNVFHRTKMLNHMTAMSVTRYIMNWDSDVMVSPISILRTMTLLRSGATLVYPYNRTFIRLEREKWFNVLMDKLDIDLLYNQPFEEKDVTVSLGGAVAFNKESYKACGLENENFISFGAEDVERYERVKMLHGEVNILCSNAPLYHMNHFRGTNSTPHNPHFSQNRREYEKVINMTLEELKEYISSWNQTQALTL
jgi:predicted glycosyltransferase involved in capsule biosynthesis